MKIMFGCLLEYPGRHGSYITFPNDGELANLNNAEKFGSSSHPWAFSPHF